MSMSTYKPEQSEMFGVRQPKYPMPGVLDSVAGNPLAVSPEDYPWINQGSDIAIAEVTLLDGTQFRMGSLIGLNGKASKIAESVSDEESNAADTALYQGLPDFLQGIPTPSINKVDNSKKNTQPFFVASKVLQQETGLIFVTRSDMEVPTILRVGVTPPPSNSKKYGELLRLIGVKQGTGQRRKR